MGEGKLPPAARRPGLARCVKGGKARAERGAGPSGAVPGMEPGPARAG